MATPHALRDSQFAVAEVDIAWSCSVHRSALPALRDEYERPTPPTRWRGQLQSRCLILD
jgi:hypothetical protein